ncbi:uncharacterized protein EV422DRAFT_496194 [Fimicolochytrium jonesii]|uniref:uncharacterized protein n=1 Tax=Fimicolochytrium jonesii TaxID=1396493 RepID=UPI0022FE484A|nr:uncharacterized protein EV422DRAFT_496194 [Fimicolochytrium jonesii]KAI8821031.1 hypothetical protein EV422DRAFT_496194 [Fimicolochytrium jonesii]
MSTRSKATFAASCIFTASTIAAVYYWQDMSFQTRRVGLVRDDERRAQWRENVRELERQEALRETLEKDQSVRQTA